MFQLQIKIRELLAMLFIASNDADRHYLNGVLLQARHTGENRLVSTDGNRMLIQRFVYQIDNVSTKEDDFDVIIPRSFISSLKKSRKSLVTLQFSAPKKETPNVRQITAIADTTLTVDSIDGVFPNYARVIPDYYNCEVANFNPSLIEDFVQASMMYCGAKKNEHDKYVPSISYNGRGPARVNMVHQNLFGIIMPFYPIVTAELNNPSWISSASNNDYSHNNNHVEAIAEFDMDDLFEKTEQDIHFMAVEKCFGDDSKYVDWLAPFKVTPISVVRKKILFKVECQIIKK